MTTSLDIIIVNWNAGQQLRDCLNSLALADTSYFKLSRVIVVDNGSSDGSADEVVGIALPLIRIRNENNMGFSVACNQGAEGSSAEYLLFLNPDMQIFRNTLGESLRFMEEPINANIGIVGIQLVDARGEISRTCARFPTPRRYFLRMMGLDRFFPNAVNSHFMTEWDHRENREVDQVMGAYFLVRRPLFESLGKFDERFFVYFEEVDFSYRAAKAGWRSYYLSTVQAYHKGGGTSERVKAARLFYNLRSRILYSYKHFSLLDATGVMLGTILIELPARIAFGMLHFSLQGIVDTLKGYGLLLMDLPRVLVTAYKLK